MRRLRVPLGPGEVWLALGHYCGPKGRVGAGMRTRFRVHAVEDHRALVGSSYFVSPFEEAAVVSVHGSGDFGSGMWGRGRGGRSQVSDEVAFPLSLGLFYVAIKQYLGFPHYGDENKVMGLAPFGEQDLIEKMRRIVHRPPGGEVRAGTRLRHAHFRRYCAGVGRRGTEDRARMPEGTGAPPWSAEQAR